MKIDLSTGELWNLLQEGSTNQRDFINSLYYNEFKEFIEEWEYLYNDLDLRSCLNGGCLFVEDTPTEDYVIWKNDRVGIVLIWLYIWYV